MSYNLILPELIRNDVQHIGVTDIVLANDIRNSKNVTWRGSVHSEWRKDEQDNNAGKVLMP